MMKLDYNLSDEWNSTVETDSLSTMDETELRYGAFLGDIILIVNGRDASTKWGWVPLLDWSLSFRFIRDEFSSKAGGTSKFEFTDSDSFIEFIKNGNYLTVSTSYQSWVEAVAFNEFSDAVDELNRRIFRDAATAYPQLLTNREFIRLSESVI